MTNYHKLTILKLNVFITSQFLYVKSLDKLSMDSLFRVSQDYNKIVN